MKLKISEKAKNYMSLQHLLDKTKEEINKNLFYKQWISTKGVNKELLENIIWDITQSQLAVIEEVINELESNPNEDGSISPNIQHFIEKKQTQLRKIINQLTIKE